MIGELLVELGRDDLVIVGEIRGHLVALQLDRDTPPSAGRTQAAEEDTSIRSNSLVVQTQQFAPSRRWPRRMRIEAVESFGRKVGLEGDVA